MINEEENGKIEMGVDLVDIYFLKIGKVRYLKSRNYKKNHCQICGKKRKTTAHHLIPKRLQCICPHLAEVRVRVCSECDEKFHPENKFIKESDIVKKQSNNISNLKDAIRWRDNKSKKIRKKIKMISKDMEEILGIKDEDFYITKKENKKESVEPSTFLKNKKEVGKDGE